jgi:hypothetical protein
MRTTINIEDDALVVAQTYARARALKLGQAVSELIRRGGVDKMPVRKRGAAWVFDLPPDAPKVTAEQVKQLLDDAA